MIRLEPVIREDGIPHFVLTSDEPMRMDVSGISVRDGLIAFVYTGLEVDMDQEPLGAYLADESTGPEENTSWEHR